jgi:regulator of protease activity HflC (stomatin/prohibitin superfamily)
MATTPPIPPPIPLAIPPGGNLNPLISQPLSRKEALRHILEHFDVVAFLVTIVIFIVPITIGTIIGNRLNIAGLGWVVVVMCIIYMFESIQTLQPGEVGAMTILGKPYKHVGAGPVYAPRGIIRVLRENGRIVEIELPAEPQFIWRGTEKDENAPPPDSRFRPPIRILFGMPSDDPKFRDDPYNIRVFAEVPIFLSYQVTDAVLWFTNMGSHEQAQKNIEDTAIRLFNAEFVTLSPAVVTAAIDSYSDKLKERLDGLVEMWGITIRIASIKPLIFSHKLNTAVVGVSESRENAKTTVIKAEAEKKRLTEEGIGTANAKRSLLLAEADGLLASLSKKTEGVEKMRVLLTKEHGLDAAQLETLVESLRSANLTFLTGGDGLMQAVIGAFKTATADSKKGPVQ